MIFSVKLGARVAILPSDMADLVSTRASHWIGGRAFVLTAHLVAIRRGNCLEA